MGDVKGNFTIEFVRRLRGSSPRDIALWFEQVVWLARRYIYACQLDGDLLLVLDNNIVQDFKHQQKPDRRLRALAFVAFCRFVAGWSPRPTRVALSAVTVYEQGCAHPFQLGLGGSGR